MKAAQEFHDKAMDFASVALLERAVGNTEKAAELFEQALENELAAIDALEEPIEPTFSVLHRSAGTLALDCKRYRKAERIVATALARGAHPAIEHELREVLEQAQANLQSPVDTNGIAKGKRHPQPDETMRQRQEATGD